LNDWNAWNGSVLMVERSGETIRAAGTGFLFALERRFQHEKVAPKLLNRADSAPFFS